MLGALGLRNNAMFLKPGACNFKKNKLVALSGFEPEIGHWSFAPENSRIPS
jgi:hypothetical protein